MEFNTELTIVTIRRCSIWICHCWYITIISNISEVNIGIIDVYLVKRLYLMPSDSNDPVEMLIVCTCSFIVYTSATNTHLTIYDLMV